VVRSNVFPFSMGSTTALDLLGNPPGTRSIQVS
jgi:hypothetical protein